MSSSVWDTIGMSPDPEVTGMQDASSHHDLGLVAPNQSRIRVGWVLAILTLVPLVLLILVAYDFATNDYIEGESLVGKVLISFFAPLVVFLGLLTTALIRSGKNGSRIDRTFRIGIVLALLGALVAVMGIGSAWIAGAVMGGIGMILMGVGALKT